MNASVLLQKLIEIERSIGVDSESTTRRKVLEAQDYILKLHWGSEDGSRARASEGDQSEKFYMLRKFGKAS